MKIKVTVELDEGTKSTTTMNLTAETIIVMLSNSLGEDQPKYIMSHDIARLITDSTRDAATTAINRVIGTISKYGMLYQYEDKDGERQLYPIKDVDEFRKFKRELESYKADKE